MIEALIARVALWCTAIVGILLIAIAYMAVRNRSLFGIAMRTVLVSRKKSVLVIFGLVLSTILTTASLGLGDSMGASMQSQTAAQTGQRDERLTKVADHDSQIWQYFAPGEAQQLMSQLQANPEVANVAAAVNTQGDVEPGTINTQGFVPIYDKSSNSVSAENQVLAVPSNFDSVWGPLYSASGQTLHFADLQPGDVYVGATLAHFIKASAGHRLTIFLNGMQVEVTVRAVLNTEVDPSEKYTMVMPLTYFQQMEKVPGAVNVIYVRNKDQNQPAKSQALLQQVRKQFGNVQATQQLKDFLNQLPRFKSRLQTDFNSNVPPIDPSRTPIIAFMNLVGKPQVTQDLVNSVQDKSVQSMLKRVVTKIDKNKLPQLYHLEEQVSHYRLEDFKQDALFLSQLAGAGTSLGLLAVSSLLIAAAMLLIYLIFIMLMAERKMELGISRALGLQRSHLIQMQIFEGMIYILISTIMGIPLGIGVTALLVVLVDHLPVPPWGGGNAITIDMHVSVPGLVIAFAIGFLVTFIVVAISAYRISRLTIVTAIRDLEEPVPPQLTMRQLVTRTKGAMSRGYRAFSEEKNLVALPRLVLTVIALALQLVWAVLQRSLFLLLLGLLITFLGSKNRDLFIYTVGISLCIISTGLLVRWLLSRTGQRQYIADKVGFTILGCGLVLYWALPVGTIEKLMGLYGVIDMAHFRHGYLLKGSVSSVTMVSVVLVVIGSIWFVLYNGDWLLKGLLFLMRPFGNLSATLRLSVLYALKNRLRTGLTITMFALVSFVVVLFLTMGTEISHNSGVKHQSGNWQILTDSTGLPHDFNQQVMADPHLSQMIERAGAAENAMLTFHIANPRGTTSTTGFMRALNDDFLDDPQLHIFPRGEGYSSDDQVWNAVKTQPDVAVMYFDSSVEWGVQPNETTFKPFDVQVVNADGTTHTVKVIGFIPSGNAWPLAFVSARTGQQIYGAPVESNWFVFRVKPGVDANQVQAALSATFGQKYGMQPELNSTGATKLSSFLTSVFNLLAGYLTLGLIIGLCGLTVISRRVVLERVQQIGVLRAIGCGSEQIPRIFLFESSFIAFLGLFIGAALALWWAYQFTMTAFPPIDGNDHVFQVPVIQIGVIIVAFYLIILVATYLPARMASRIAPAAALRYE